MRARRPSSDRAWSLDAKRAARRRDASRRREVPAEQPAAPPRVVEIVGGQCNQLVGDHDLCPRYWPTVPAGLLRLGGSFGTPQAAVCVCWCHREHDLAQQ